MLIHIGLCTCRFMPTRRRNLSEEFEKLASANNAEISPPRRGTILPVNSCLPLFSCFPPGQSPYSAVLRSELLCEASPVNRRLFQYKSSDGTLLHRCLCSRSASADKCSPQRPKLCHQAHLHFPSLPSAIEAKNY